MIDIKNVLEAINEIVVIPVAIITFLLLTYISIYLWKKDPDIIRSKIFLKYREFKQAFLLLAVFGLALVFHVSLIYIPRFYEFENVPLIRNLQRFFGLTLTIIMIGFAFYLKKSFK